MINCTLAGLTLSSLYSNSPFLMMPIKNQISSNIIISNFYFSYYFSNFYYSSNANRQQIYTKIKNSHFSNFLSRVIYITDLNTDENNIITNQIFTQRQEFPKSSDKDSDNPNFESDKPLLSKSVVINKCNFENIFTKSEEGGCIYAEVNLAISESFFSSCSSRNGCIHCNNSYLTLFATTFQSCIAQYMSSCFTQYYYGPKNRIPTSISSVSFLDSKSLNLFGIFYINSVNPFSLTNSNITNCGATQCVGSFEISSAACFIKYTKFQHSYARVHNGCIVLRNPSSLFIDSSTFVQCQQITTLTETGCDLLLYNVPPDSLIKNTAFIESDPSKGFSITAVNGIELTFENCIFSYPRDVEINPSSSYLCVLTNTIFGCLKSENNQDKDAEMVDVEDTKKRVQCNKIKDEIDRKISKSNENSISNIRQRLSKNEYNDKYLNILFEYDSKISYSTTVVDSTNFLSKLAEKIAEKDFCINHKIQKKHVIFFFIYIVFLFDGFILVLAFELINQKYPSLCVIKPNKGGFIQAKTPHAIL